VPGGGVASVACVMKTRTILLSLLLSAAAVAILPGAQAEMPSGVEAAAPAAPDTCPPLHTDSVILGIAIQPSGDTCHVWVGLIDGTRVCGALAGFEHEQVREDVTVGGTVTGDPKTVHVVANYCVPILDCTCPPLDLLDPSAAAMAPPPIIVCIREPCPGVPVPNYCTLESATPGANPYTTLNPRERVWGTDAGCDIDVESNWSCAPPSGGYVERTVGPVHVKILVCDGGIGDLIELDAIAASAAQPPIYCVMEPCGPCTCPPPTIDVTYCKAKSVTPDQVPMLGMAVNPRDLVWGTDAGCDIDVEGPDMTCAPPSSTGIDRTVGPVHVRAGVCDGGIPDRLGELIGPIATT
jgi:hypothetical protein